MNNISYMKDNIILGKSKKFALSVITLYQKLQDQKEFVLSKQLLRSGTSIGANVYESVFAQSKKDFFTKICIALKESHETLYWLELLRDSQLTNIDIEPFYSEWEEILKILIASKKTTEKSLQKNP